MKKILLGTTAVVALATISTEAFAADKIKLELGGFMRHYVGLMNHDEVAPAANSGSPETSDIAQWSNTEVYFKGSTALDNGLTVGVTMQLEADREAAGRRMDETFVTISSDAMGEVKVGAALSHADGMIVRVPNASNFDWGDLNGNVRKSTDNTAANNANDWADSANDVSDMGGREAKISYLSPSFSGVQVYGYWTAANGTEVSNGRGLVNSATAANNTANDGSAMGIAYSGEMSGASVGVDLTHRRNASNFNATHVGVNVGMAGFTVGGGYTDFNDDSGVGSPNDGNAWELGVGYETGPYALSARYMVAKNQDTTAAVQDNKDTKYALDATYDLGAGVKLAATYFHMKADPEDTVPSPTTFATGKSAKVSGVLAGIEVGF